MALALGRSSEKPACAATAATAASPPRTLKEPVGWKVSTLSETLRPSCGAVTTGVIARCVRTTFHAASCCASWGGVTVRMASSLSESHLAC